MSRRPGRWWGSWWERAIRAVVALYPPEFRDTVGRDMCETFLRELSRRRRERGWLPALAFGLGTLAAGAWGAALETTRRGDGRGGVEIVDTFLQDLRHAARALRHAPGFTLVTIATFALGLGATTAIFGVAWSIWLKPLPYDQPDRLVQLRDTRPGAGLFGISNPEVDEYRRRAHSFEALGAYQYGAGFVTVGDEPTRVVSYRVEPGLFPLLGMPAALGRTFGDDDARDDARVVVLSDAFWRERFGATPGVLGRTLDLNGSAYTIVGVMPGDFVFPEHAPSDVWLPLPRSWLAGGDRSQRYTRARARLKPGVTLEAAREETGRVAEVLGEEYPATNAGWSVRLTPVTDIIFGDYRRAFGALLGAVAILLLVACVNIASVFLARNTARRHEFAVRAALGAGRWRLAAQVLTESMVLAVLGGAVGFALARLGTTVLSSYLPSYTPRIGQVRVDVTVFLFAAVAAGGAGVLSGLLPSLRGGAAGPADALRASARTLGSSGRHRLQSGLVISEVALSVVLLVGGGLMVRSFSSELHRDRGFTSGGLLTLHVTFPQSAFETPAERTQGFRDILQQVAGLPDVASAAAVTGFPGGSLGYLGAVPVHGGDGALDSAVVSDVRAVSPGYFHAMGVPLLAGRDFVAREVPEGATPVIVNRTLARRLWGDERAAVGHIVTAPDLGTADTSQTVPEARVVGVVGDISLGAVPRPELYSPLDLAWAWWGDLVVRARTDPRRIAPAVREAVRSYDPGMIIEDVQPMDAVLSDLLALQRAQSMAVSLFAWLTLVLSAVGLYGLLAWLVGQRVPEMGVRVALGAGRGEVFAVVAREAFRLTLAGIAGGVAGALLLARVLRSQVFGLDHIDPGVVVTTTGVLLAVALVACWVPARRAMRVDPVDALR